VSFFLAWDASTRGVFGWLLPPILHPCVRIFTLGSVIGCLLPLQQVAKVGATIGPDAGVNDTSRSSFASGTVPQMKDKDGGSTC
jgi:hypothetical protein